MLLRNYDNIITARRKITTTDGYVSTDTDVFGDGHINVKDVSGVIRKLYSSTYWTYSPFEKFEESYNDITRIIYSGWSKLVLGGGDANVTYDDYNLSSPFTDSQIGYVGGSQNVVTEYDENTNIYTHTYRRIFTALEDITVKEIGVVNGFPYTNGSNYFRNTLVYREVLAEPISVTSGSNIVVSFQVVVGATPNKPADYVASVSVE